MDFNDIPTIVKKEALKIKQTHTNIYCLRMAESYYIIRPLTRKEFMFLTSLRQYMLDSDDEFVLNNCVLYPNIEASNINNMLAGTVEHIINTIISLSGFSSPDFVQDLMDESRSLAGLADNQMILTICKAFPGLDPEKIDDFDIQKIIYYLSLAEQMLGVTLEFQKDKKQNTQSNSSIDFMTENKGLRDQGFFGNMDPRTMRPNSDS